MSRAHDLSASTHIIRPGIAVAACAIRGRAASEYDELRSLPGISAGRPGYCHHHGMEKFHAKKIA
jgi:hypothetical protein